MWETYRNKLVLLEMLAPNVTTDVIQSLIDKGEKTGFMPTFFHGDHVAPFVSGLYLRGIRDFDVQTYFLTYKILKSAYKIPACDFLIPKTQLYSKFLIESELD